MTILIKKAQELEKKSQYKNNKKKKNFYLDTAFDYYERAIENKSSHYDVRCDMGRILNKQNRFRESEKYFDVTLTIDSQHVDSWFGLGISYLGQGKWDNALSSFKKGLEINDKNANLWYFSSIILKELNDEDADRYYKKFLKLDNKHNFENRKGYKFFENDTCPVSFLNSKLKLENKNQIINISGLKKLLSSYDLNYKEILLMLRTLSENELKDKISQMNDKKYESNEKNIIYTELFKLGFSKSDVEDMIQIDGIESIKEEVLSRVSKNPFPLKSNSPEINLIVDSHSDNYSNLILDLEYGNFNTFNPIDFASKYNMFNKIRIPKSEEISYRSKIISSSKYKPYLRHHKINRIKFQFGLNYLKDNNFEEAIDIFKNVTEFDPEIYVNANFFIASLFAYNKEYELAIKYFDNIEGKFKSLKYYPHYLFNKGNLLYDLGKFKEAIECYKFLENPSAKILQICAYYNYKLHVFE